MLHFPVLICHNYAGRYTGGKKPAASITFFLQGKEQASMSAQKNGRLKQQQTEARSMLCLSLSELCPFCDKLWVTLLIIISYNAFCSMLLFINGFGMSYNSPTK